MMYLERTIRRLSSRDGELRANNKRTSRCGAYRACSDLVLSACCTANKRHLLSGRDLDDKTTSRVAPGTPRDDEIPGWSLQARLRAREGGLKSLEVLWVLGVDPAAGGGPEDQRMAVLHLTEKPILLNYRSVTRGVTFDFFLPLFRADPARCPGEVSSELPP